MIYFLEQIESFVEIALALRVSPEHVPVVAIRLHQPIDFEDKSDKFGVTFQHLVVHCRVLDS